MCASSHFQAVIDSTRALTTQIHHYSVSCQQLACQQTKLMLAFLILQGVLWVWLIWQSWEGA